METKISTEILIKILNNVQSSRSTRNLYSSLLVNRFWCKATVTSGHDLIGSILKLPGALKVFKKLKSFTWRIEEDDEICPLYESLALICDNILNMDLSLNSYSQVQLLTKLISVQKRLENLSIVYEKRFEILSIVDDDNDDKKLYIEYCRGLYNSDILYSINPEQVMAISNNNFNELRSFSFYCEEEIDANELLCQMAENASESIETIEIRMGIFSADSLKKFFEGWCCKGKGGNKKFIVKRTEQARLFTLNDKHFKVIEEYGVQFNIE
ncbi:hypothetical protein Glove_707g35 [Diversispora epigaea]|uniref:F-box domain-containing protein n=1 Tax=Diversispora epigaea TaxID=1348612 RepID=A0A397G1V0_9GLOM|nr:hypothetical protein Glove_707g35 [Diversispora epigaea]